MMSLQAQAGYFGGKGQIQLQKYDALIWYPKRPTLC